MLLKRAVVVGLMRNAPERMPAGQRLGESAGCDGYPKGASRPPSLECVRCWVEGCLLRACPLVL